MTEAARDTNHALTIQLLEWIAGHPRSYAEVLDAWKTSCPRLSIWEDACIAGLIECDKGPERIVHPSEKGQALLRWHRDGFPPPDSAIMKLS